MFNKFADGARRAVVLAQEEARESGDRRITPAHLLLGIAESSGIGTTCLADAGLDHAGLRERLTSAEGDGIDAEALASVGIDLDAVRASSQESFGPGALDRRGGPRSFGHIPFTRGAKGTLEQALRAAVRLGNRSIDTGHVLLGVLAVDDDVVRGVLSTAGVDARALAADVERRLRDAAA